MTRLTGRPNQSPWQSGLQGHPTLLWLPGTGTAGQGSGFGLGWAPSGVITDLSPGPASLAASFQRTRFESFSATTNQMIGLVASGTPDQFLWRGASASVGGFYCSFRFAISTYPGDACRLFAGLGSSVGGAVQKVVTSDTVTGGVVGLWHDSTDGGTRLSIVTCNGGAGTTKTVVNNVPALSGKPMFDFYLYCGPNSNTVYWKLDDVLASTNLDGGSVTANLPPNSFFMSPEVSMSNAAFTAASSTSLTVTRIYCASEQ